MISDANLTIAQKSITAAGTAGTVASVQKSDVFDFGADSAINVPKGAKIVVTLGAAMTNANSYLKLLYGKTLSSGDIASPSESPEVFKGSSTSTDDAYTRKVYVFHLDNIANQSFRYLQLGFGNAVASATTLDAMVVLETPHNSGAVV